MGFDTIEINLVSLFELVKDISIDLEKNMRGLSIKNY